MIPNIIHFVFGLEKSFGQKPFSVFHYVAVRSALEINRPEQVFIYYKYEPTGYWWSRVVREKLATPVLISVPRQVYGNKLYHYAHKADVVRLMLLIEYGGIYLDIDTLCIRPLTDLLDHSCVMARETCFGVDRGLCNAVILAEKSSRFLQQWMVSYRHFRSKGPDLYWGEHSVRVPLKIAGQYPETIHIEPAESFFYPSYTDTDLELLFEKSASFPGAYVFHLWESIAYNRYLCKLTEAVIKNEDTSYNVIARQYL